MNDRTRAVDGTSGAQPLAWALTSFRDGDNAQVLALAEEIRWLFEQKSLTYNILHVFAHKPSRPSLTMLTRAARRLIVPPWPDLIIASGRRAIPAALWIKRRNQGRTRIVIIGRPRTDPRLFDLVFTTHQYAVDPAPNVHLLPVAMSRFRGLPQLSDAERDFLAPLPRPHLLFAMGGPTGLVRLPPKHMAAMTAALCRRARERGGTLIAVGSRRTTHAMLDAVRRAITTDGHDVLVEGNSPSFAALMADADEIFPTAESVSMISEALITGKPVGLVPGKGQRHDDLTGSFQIGGRGKGRDLRRFWAALREQRLGGTIDAPRAAALANPVIGAAAQVRALFDARPNASDFARKSR